MFKQLLLRNLRWILLKFAMFTPERRYLKADKRIFNSDKIRRSYCDFYFGVIFLEHSVVHIVSVYGIIFIER